MDQQDFELKVGTTFTANDRKYKVNDSFKVGRLQMVTLLEDELAQMAENKTCHSAMTKALHHINKAELGEAYVLLYNKIEHDKKVMNISHYALRICAAYINYEGEDDRFLTEETIKEKINDWAMEGLPVDPFMFLAVRKSREQLEIYKEGMLGILEQKLKIAESLNLKIAKSDGAIPNLQKKAGRKK